MAMSRLPADPADDRHKKASGSLPFDGKGSGGVTQTQSISNHRYATVLMLPTNTRRLLAVACLFLLITGCGGRKTYQVTGRVQYKDGSPIKGGVRTIQFEPADNTTAEIRKMAIGEIAEDGSFTMYTRQPGDGVIPGIYIVTFRVLDKPLGGKSLIPEKYQTAATSPFDIHVDSNKSDQLYELEKR